MDKVCMMTRYKFSWMGVWVGAWMAAAPITSFTTPVAPTRDKISVKTDGRVRMASLRQGAASRSADTFDAGDFYVSPSGQRRLHRLAGAMAVRFKSPAVKASGLRELSLAGGSLKNFALDFESAQGLAILQAAPSERERQRRDPARLRDALTKARQAGTVRSAHPIFVEPQTGQLRLPTGEILVCLKPGTDPKSYFGRDGSAVTRLRGTPDTFVLTRESLTAEALFAEANQRATDRRVTWAQPNFLSQVIKQTSDPLFDHQWNLRNGGLNGAVANADINAPEAWETSSGTPGVVIAILDDGVQLDHPDLASNLFSLPGETANAADDDGNGYVDDLHGWDFYRNDNNAGPEFASDSHGTAVAGVAVAAGNNNLGGVGVAYRCQIMPLKVIANDSWVPDSTMAEAIYYAAGRTRNGLSTWRGADIINISLSFPQSAVADDALSWAATHGRGGKGCPIFAAAGDQASRWRATRVRLPVGALVGPGSYQFGFEYSKDSSDSSGEDLVRIDNVTLLDDDGVTQLDSAFGANGRQDFEGTFPPTGWTMMAAGVEVPSWSGSTNGALSGSRGSFSAQAGAIGNFKWTELRTPVVSLVGSELLSFSCSISSEARYDGLKIWIYDGDGVYLDVFAGTDDSPYLSGNPVVSTAVTYPASHPNVIAVGASTDADVRADYSAYGAALAFVVPSSGGWNDIITTDRTGADGYVSGDAAYDFGGTSAASSLAAGIGAMLLSINPQLTVTEVLTLLKASCEKIGNVAYDGNGWNQFHGFGRLNAQAAVEQVMSSFHVSITSPAHNAILFTPGNFVITASATNENGTVARVEFYAGSTRLGEDSTAPYSILWTNPANGSYTLSARATDGLGATIYSSAVEVMVAPGLSISAASVTEGNAGTTNAVFNVRLSARSTRTVSVNFNVADGSAVAGRDYVPVSGTLAFPPGTTNLTIRVPVIGNRLSDGTRMFAVHLSDPVNSGIAQGVGVGTIVDNRDPLPAILIGDVTITEGDSGTPNVSFDVRLSTRSGQTVTVQYATANGTALGNVDYIPVAGVVSFAPGMINQTITIPVVGDTLHESNKTFFVNLTNAVNATIADRQGRATILDDDFPPLITLNDVSIGEGHTGTANATFTVSLSARSGLPISVNYATANGSAVAAKDFRAATGVLKFAPGVTNLAITVAVLGDRLHESNETFVVNLTRSVNANISDAQGLGTILDDDSEPTLAILDAQGTETDAGRVNSVFRVRLSAPSGRSVSVSYATADGTALAGSDYAATNGTLLFLPGVTNQIIRVPILGNTVSESNETYFVILTNAVNATLGDGQAIGRILDNDRLPVLSVNDITVTEGNVGATNAGFTVRLSTSSGRVVTVNYATSNRNAQAGVDYVAANGVVTFGPGVTNQTVLVAVLGDMVSEINKTFALQLTGPVNATVGDGVGLCNILDNDLVTANNNFRAASVPPAGSGEFKIASAEIVGTNVIIRFTAPAGQTIRLEYTDGLTGATTAWQPVPGATNLLGTGGIITGTHPGGASQSARFYRLNLVP